MQILWCLPTFQITIGGKKTPNLEQSPEMPGKGWWELHMVGLRPSWDRLCCWVGTVGWMNNETGVSEGRWMVSRNLRLLWRKTRWWIIQRPDSTGTQRSPNLLKNGGKHYFQSLFVLLLEIRGAKCKGCLSTLRQRNPQFFSFWGHRTWSPSIKRKLLHKALPLERGKALNSIEPTTNSFASVL